ncbi:MAG: FAD-dependent oxidoreductase [Bdellovibrionales bacterium]|nr:FAD-dependent oxidoreductase [Bdellovibrionales bacterium]
MLSIGLSPVDISAHLGDALMGHSPILRRLRSLSAKKVSRRRLLQWSILSATSMFVVPRTCGKDLRVGIIGSGAAGLAAAFWLKKHRVSFQLVEASGRFGGRIFTVDSWNEDKQFVELGGELINTGDQETLWLARELQEEQNRMLNSNKNFEPQDLRILKFKDEELDSKLHASLFNVNGRVYTEQQFFKAVAQLVPHLAKMNKNIFGDFDGDFTYLSAKRFPEARKMDETPLSGLLDSCKSFAEPWCLEILRAAYEAEFGLSAEEQSSLNFLLMFDTDLIDGFSLYGESDEALRIGGGNSALTRATVNSLNDYNQNNLDNYLQFDRQVRSISRSRSKFICHFERGRSEEYTHLIVAVPITQLRRIEGWDKLEISKPKQRFIRDLRMGQNSKAMLGFKQRFWRQTPIFDGRGSQGEMYLSKGSGIIWETSRLQSGSTGILTLYSTGEMAKRVGLDPHEPLQIIKDNFSSQAGALYTGERIHFNWPRFGLTEGSFSCLGLGQFSDFWGAGSEPECDGRLIFAGEHTSVKSQGFINGGFESGFRAARQILEKI